MRYKFDENGGYINFTINLRIFALKKIWTWNVYDLNYLYILIRVKYNLRITSGVDSNRFKFNKYFSTSLTLYATSQKVVKDPIDSHCSYLSINYNLINQPII